LKKHDLHDFLNSTQRELQEEYERIQRRAADDPGTAGDQGEENWATVLRKWLPKYFYIVTKGRILTDKGFASPQVDILVLHPSYPQFLLDKKMYLASGVAAAFECKTTLNASHVEKAVKTSALIKSKVFEKGGTPYKELNSSIIYGILAHSHSWKKDRSQPDENIRVALQKADQKHVKHPIESLDFITVADLGTWTNRKISWLPPMEGVSEAYYIATSYVCASFNTEGQEANFSPVGVLLSGLFSKLSWLFQDMRGLESYFRKLCLATGRGPQRHWPQTAYSKELVAELQTRPLRNGPVFDEWKLLF